jgi:uncharacterized cofD-like protein
VGTTQQSKIVLLGGGTGSFTLLQGLKKLTPRLTAIVNMSDDGGSTGVLRDELGVLPPGDVRQCLVALSDTPEVRDLFSYRFAHGRLRGQSLGNIILSGLELQYGNFEEAIRIASELLDLEGAVVPVTLTKHRLMLRDGLRIVRGQDRINKYRIKRANHRLWLSPVAHINPAAEAAILQADLVVLAPGGFYGSLLPICNVTGVPQALRRTPAQVVSVTNLVNKPGQTDDWHVADYVRHLEACLGEGVIDTVLYNSQPITERLLTRYAAEGEFPVRTDRAGFAGLHARAVGSRLVSRDIAEQDPADRAIRRTLIRHDAGRVCAELDTLLG